MIVIDNFNNISVSQGDTLIVEFTLAEPPVVGDKAIFSIMKKNLGVVLQSTLDGFEEGNTSKKLTFMISAEDMGKIPAGRYYYDLKLEDADGIVFTTSWTKELRILPTAHGG